MTYQNKTIKDFFKGGITMLLLLSMIVSMQAQDKTAASLYNDGLAKLKEKDFESGLSLMEEALVLATEEENEQVISLAKKNGAVAAYNIGNTKRKAKMVDEALTFFEKGIELNPEYASNHFGKALILEEKGMSLESLQALLLASDKYTANGKASRAVKLEKKAQNEVGRAYTGKDYDLAISLGNAYLETHVSPDVHYYVARSFIEKGDNETALTHATKAIETSMAETDDETKDKFYIAKALALENLNRNSEAIEAYKMVTDGKYKEQAEYKIQALGSK